MKLKAVREALSTLGIRRANTLDEIVAAISTQYGKPIYLEALPSGDWGSLTAFLDEGPDHVTVFFRLQDSPQYRLQCVCHELGHLVMDTDCSRMIDSSLATKVGVSAGTIRMQARDLRNTDAEREVEEFAYALVQRLRSRSWAHSRAGVVLA
ncbi:hypothetical protein [Leucobacter musarum]|uniref:hypothetical protein n=1 Tax=Leucobacter musarum TaxID=1930747 RepID=UPI0012E20C98|nr:hypothetical protein [Leucobacter musarum]